MTLENTTWIFQLSDDKNVTLGNEDVSLSDAIVSGIFLGLIIILTLFGNSLVITAVIGFPRLRSTTNMFIVSLAIADITVAVLVMPFSLIYGVLKRWLFGWIFCYFWISCDVMCCTASILHLCVISLDRYVAITKPLKYKTLMSRYRAILLIIGIWLCGGFMSFIPIYLGWFADKDVEIYKDSPKCGLFVNKIYAVVSSMTSFYIPLLVMICAYYKIYCIARAQVREIQKLEVSARNTGVKSDERIQRKSRRIARDTKAVKTLGTLMGLFVISWLPFFLMYLILPFCDNCYLPAKVELLITWLGYVNSLINPCVYALLNKDFRLAFRQILCCRGWKRNVASNAHLNGHYTPCMERNRTTLTMKTRVKRYSDDSAISVKEPDSKQSDKLVNKCKDNNSPKCSKELNGNLTDYKLKSPL